MQLKPLPHYFIVKIEIEKQKERKEKIGSLYVHHAHAHMTRNLQQGEIIAIGNEAAKKFPQASVGDTLIMHHFVESELPIYSTTKYNFYNVTASDYNGRKNESYAIFHNGEIIPHPDFIFIEPEIKEEEISTDKFIEQKTQQVGSLILFTNWEESREAKEEQSKRLLEEIKQASKGKTMRHDAKVALEEKQKEAGIITESLNKKKYLPYKIAAYNPKLQRSYNSDLKTVSKIFALNIAAQTIVSFHERDYIIVETKYCVAIAS